MLNTKKQMWERYTKNGTKLEKKLTWALDGIEKRLYECKEVNSPTYEFYYHLEKLGLKALKMRIKTRVVPETYNGVGMEINKDSAYLMAAVQAMELCLNLKNAADTYFDGDKTLDAYYKFKDSCSLAINDVKPELEKHRGLKQILGNIMLAVLGLGVGYAAACVVNKITTGKFLFFKTDSEIKVNALEESLKKIPLPVNVPLDAYWSKQWETAYLAKGYYSYKNKIWAALDLLAEYAGFLRGAILPFSDGGAGGRLGRFFTGKWGRRYGDAVQDAVGYYFHMDADHEDLSLELALSKVKERIGNSHRLHPNDDLAKIIKVIEANTGIVYEQLNADNVKKSYQNLKG